MSVVTVSSALKSACIDKDLSVYSDFSDSQMNFPMSLIGSFDVCSSEQELKIFAVWRKFYACLEAKKSDSEYQKLLSDVKAIELKNREINVYMREILVQGGHLSEADIKFAKNLRTQKKEILERIKYLENNFELECKKELNLTKIENKILRYKKELFLNNYENIRAILPLFPEKSKMPYWHEMPFFTGNLEKLKRSIDAKEEICIEGGPCLFGLQEVYVVIVSNDGTEHKFDYNTAHYGPEDTGEASCESLENLLSLNSESVADVYFIDQKKGLTRQEYYELLYPFEMAKIFNAKLIIPIPDFSYIKYVTALADKLKPEIKFNMISRFKEICFRISDLMLAKIHEISKDYPNIEYKVVHYRDIELCEEFEIRREQILLKDKSQNIARHLTKNEYRQQSILDYCTMPAMPLYLYGIKNILQVDCVDEVDSYRKCCQLHKTKINLSAVLYPEYLSRDGKNTVFYSKIEDKDYI